MSDECVFCDIKDRVIKETEYMILIESKFEVAPKGHYLIIPKRHVDSCYELNNEEWLESKELIEHAKYSMKYDDSNVGWNDGKFAGQTIMHAHIHVIGRKEGDVKDPRGGIRNVIPTKGNYLK